MSISKAIITSTLETPHGETAFRIVEALEDAGFDTWWVGGAVRDMLEGHVPQDIDIATVAVPDDVINILSAMFTKIAFNEVGKEYGNLIVTLKNHDFEITTFREDDQASDGRFPGSVTFGTKEDDAQRRDITINAIYFHPISREIFDPFDGEKDLNEKLIRFIGDPKVRIEHDALRLLRVVRFRALLNGQYHPETYQAMHTLAKSVQVLSGVRCLKEIEKMLMGPNPAMAFEDLWEIDTLEYLIPELHKCKGIAQPADYHHEGDVWDHTMQILRSFTPEHSLDLRIAALFHDIGKAETFSIDDERIRFDHHASVSGDIAKNILQRLQCTAKRIEKICWLIEHHMTMSIFLGLSEERKAHWYFHPWFSELLNLFWLDIAGTEPADFHLYEDIVKDYHTFLDAHPRPQKPLIDGKEVMEILGIKPGEKIGEILSALHDAQVRGEVKTKKDAKAFIENWKMEN